MRHSGFCYGWRAPCICIAGVLNAYSRQDAEQLLQALSRTSQWKSLTRSCGSAPVIIGTCEFGQRKGGRIPLVPIPTLELWTPIDYTLIYYYRHQSSTLRFYSLHGLKLDATNRPNIDEGSAYAAAAKHDFTLPRKWETTASLNDVVITQFNSAKTLENIIDHIEPRKPLLFATSVKSLGASLLPAIATLSHFLTTVCNIPFVLSSSPRLRDLSATIQQIDVRAEQGDFFVNEIGTLRPRSSAAIPLYSARYTNFYNTVWLIANDITIGFAFGTFLCENHILLSHMMIQIVENVLINWVQGALGWLDSWPAGLKLNTELSQFYSHAFIELVAVWGRFLLRGAAYLPAIIYVIGTASSGGLTFTISLFMDILAVFTVHIYICYVVSAAIYQRMLKTAGSLWNLFRGKRYNVLRNRIDSWEYDIDQLLFGTILFTLLAFLFPTVLAYYALFAMMRFVVLILQASMETLLALFNHFPLFALMLRVKDPWRLPGGIFFLRIEVPESKHPLLVVQNQPVSLSSIFFQYIQLLSLLAKHYNPLRLLRHLFLGQYLASIPRYSIRYNKIPNDVISDVLDPRSP